MRTIAVAVVLLSPLPAVAQSVRGVVADVRTGDRVPGAALVLTNDDGHIMGVATSDSTGAFFIQSVEPGFHVLMANRNGFRITESDRIQLHAGVTVGLRVNLVPEPLVLDPIEVVANNQVRSAEMRGFLQRLEQNTGLAFDREDLDNIRPGDIDDVLRWAPGTRMMGSGRNTWMAVNSNRCRPTFLIDGRRTFMPVEGYPMDWIVGVEIFRRNSSVPSQYRQSIRRAGYRDCGAVLIWTTWMR